MLNKIKNYLKYRKNRKIVKRELAAAGAAFLPLISHAGSVTGTVFAFITKVTNELRDTEGEQFFESLLEELSHALKTDNERSNADT